MWWIIGLIAYYFFALIFCRWYDKRQRDRLKLDIYEAVKLGIKQSEEIKYHQKVRKLLAQIREGSIEPPADWQEQETKEEHSIKA